MYLFAISHTEVCDIQLSNYLFVVSNWTSSCMQVLSVWGPLSCWCSECIWHWSSCHWSYTKLPKSIPGSGWGGAQWDPQAWWSPACGTRGQSRVIHWWADSVLHRLWLEEERWGTAAASSTHQTVEFEDPKCTPLEGRGLGSWSCQGTIRSDHRSPEIIRGHVAQGLSLGYKQTCNLLDVVVVHSCHKVAAMAALAYSLNNRNTCPNQC